MRLLVPRNFSNVISYLKYFVRLCAEVHIASLARNTRQIASLLGAPRLVSNSRLTPCQLKTQPLTYSICTTLLTYIIRYILIPNQSDKNLVSRQYPEQYCV